MYAFCEYVQPTLCREKIEENESETDVETFAHNLRKLGAANHLRAVAKAIRRLGDHHLAESGNNDED